MNYTDVVKPATYADDKGLHGLLTHMRANDPVAWIDTPTHDPFYALTKHADIIEVSRRSDTFINAPRAILVPRPKPGEEPPEMQARVLIAIDGEEHKALRGLSQDWFLPESLKRFEPAVREIARQSVDHMLSLGEEFDFVKDVAVWYPLKVIMKILGVPDDKGDMLLTMTQQMFGAADPDVTRDLTDEERVQLFTDFYAYCAQVCADRHQHPEDDLASVIANGRINGEPLSQMDTLGYFLIVASAGHDTTSSSTAGALHALLERPDQMKKLRDNPEFIPTMVEESIRWVTPVKHFMRTATEDYQLRDKTVEAGQSVMLLYPSANRDEDVFESPFEFRVDRRPNRHLAFGHGAHHCLGNLLAKMEMRILYEELFSRVRDMELNGEPKLIQSVFVSGLKTLPVRMKPA